MPILLSTNTVTLSGTMETVAIQRTLYDVPCVLLPLRLLWEADPSTPTAPWATAVIPLFLFDPILCERVKRLPLGCRLFVRGRLEMDRGEGLDVVVVATEVCPLITAECAP